LTEHYQTTLIKPKTKTMFGEKNKRNWFSEQS